MKELTFDKEKHEYKLHGVVIPSVTQLLKATGFSNFDNVDPELLARNARFGDAVHSMIDLYCQNKLDFFSLDPALRPYLASWENFVEDYGYRTIETEIKGYHPIYRFAFKFDQLGETEYALGTLKQSGKILLDIKTGTKKPADKFQLAGYRIGVKDKEIVGILLLYLNPEFKPRGYKVEFASNNKKEQGIFLSALTVYNAQKENGLL